MNIFQKFTFRTLKENRTRTLVTIVGIVLSVAMLTAVTTSVSSAYEYMINLEIADSGNWHGAVYGMSQTDCDVLAERSEVAVLGRLQNIGYARIDEETLSVEPYLYVGGVDATLTEQMSVHLTSGTLPQNSSEIILSDSALTQLGGACNVGDTITLSIGQRQKDGVTLWQNDAYEIDEEEPEQLVNVEEKTYTLVGIFANQYTLGHSSYTALTAYEKMTDSSYTCYLQMKDSGDVYDFLKQYNNQYVTETNDALLRFLGTSNETYFNSAVTGLAAVLIGIIMIGSISMIYNAFSISVSERTKAFGLLSSIGATKKQMRHSVNYEVGFLCLVGVPLGIVAGIVGMMVTFRVLKGLFESYLLTEDFYGVVLKMHPSWQALLIALTVGVITVYISAWIPTHRALKINTIDAIRQTQDVKIKSNKVKTSKLTSRLFGFEGMLASKNFKRNRRKYRATVASLFISVVLFISASAYSFYLTKSTKDLLGSAQYDVSYSTDADMSVADMEQMNRSISETDDIDQAGYAKLWYTSLAISKDNFSEDLLDFLNENNYLISDNDNQDIIWSGVVAFVADDEYESYLKQNGYDTATYMDAEKPVALVKDQLRYTIMTSYGTKYYVGDALNKNGGNIVSESVKCEMDGLSYSGRNVDDDGVVTYCYGSGENEVEYGKSDAVVTTTLQVGERTDKTLFSVDLFGMYSDQIVLLYPCRAYDAVMSTLPEGTVSTTSELFYKTQNHEQVYDAVLAYGGEHGLNEEGCEAYDRQEYESTMRAVITVVNIFAYGFVILISLIAMTNVFNTISTNIGLRRREFAMLKSVGMTTKGFRKMMNYECLLYGVKGLMYGLPVAFLMMWLIYRSVNEGIMQTFCVPWNSVIIAVFSVFVVVFATMLYAMHKVKTENPMDVLKNDNF